MCGAGAAGRAALTGRVAYDIDGPLDAVSLVVGDRVDRAESPVEHDGAAAGAADAVEWERERLVRCTPTS